MKELQRAQPSSKAQTRASQQSEHFAFFFFSLFVLFMVLLGYSFSITYAKKLNALSLVSLNLSYEYAKRELLLSNNHVIYFIYKGTFHLHILPLIIFEN